MLGITLKETRVYQEAQEEERLATQTEIALNMLSKQMPLVLKGENLDILSSSALSTQHSALFNDIQTYAQVY